MKRCSLKAVLTLVFLPTSFAAAQEVGHRPSNSPYHDLRYKQEITLYGGYFDGSLGKAGVAPGGSPLVGIRYAIHLGGPAEFTTHVARVSAERAVIDPSLPASIRHVGTTSFSLYLADAGLALNLTGEKTFHRFVPVIGFGAGIASDMGTDRDVGGFKVGTSFAINFGGGIRYVPGKNISVRADVSDYLYRLSYPSAYFSTPSGGGDPVLGPRTGSSQWTHNAVLTLGVSYLFSR